MSLTSFGRFAQRDASLLELERAPTELWIPSAHPYGGHTVWPVHDTTYRPIGMTLPIGSSRRDRAWAGIIYLFLFYCFYCWTAQSKFLAGSSRLDPVDWTVYGSRDRSRFFY